MALSAATAPPDLWQARPGDRLTGCNSDGTCQDYRITAAEMWPRDRVRRLLSRWPPDGGLLIYTVGEGTDAWVLQAQAQGKETTR